MRHFKIGSFFIMIALLLVACRSEPAETIVLKIPNQESYTTLFIQGVDENGTTSEATSKISRDQEEIKAFIEKVNKTEVVKSPEHELMDYTKKLNEKGNYFFVLSDKETMDNNVYTMNFFDDGRILFQEPNGKKQEPNGAGQKMIYLSKEKHSEMLQEWKDLFQITF